MRRALTPCHLTLALATFAAPFSGCDQAPTVAVAPLPAPAPELGTSWLVDAKAVFGSCLAKHEAKPLALAAFRTSVNTVVLLRVLSSDFEVSSARFHWRGGTVDPAAEMLLTTERVHLNGLEQPRLAGSTAATLASCRYDEFKMPAAYRGKVLLDFEFELVSDDEHVVREGTLEFPWPGK